jgi:ubiquitin-conjugating enzyme (huntingtin interacting protein 2)
VIHEQPSSTNTLRFYDILSQRLHSLHLESPEPIPLTMASNRLRRIAKELSDIQADTDSKIFAEPANGSDLSHLLASFPGPPDTPYEGGTYIVDIKIPNEYPFRPPVMYFKTKLWHPNVSSQTVRISRPTCAPETNLRKGAICLDTLGSAWSPVLTIKSALLSLQSLLSTPEPKDPQDAEVASMLMNYPEKFQRKAREWAINHANAPAKTNWSVNTPSVPSQAKMKVQRSKEEEMRAEALR